MACRAVEGAAARRHRQGRHRQDDGRRRPGPRARHRRPPHAADRGGGPAGHRPAVRHAAPALRGAPHRGGARRRRGAGAGRRRRGRAAGVLRDVLPARLRRAARCAGWGPSSSPPRSPPACATCCSPARPRRRVTRTDARRAAPVYDAVVLDAPPTGRVVTLPRRHRGRWPSSRAAARSTARAEGVVTVLHSPTTAVHLVTLLEDLPVTETLEAIDELRAAGLRPGAVIVNQVRPQWLPDRSVVAAADGRVDAERIRAGLAAAGLDLPAGRDRRAGRRDRRARACGCTARPLRARPAGRGAAAAGAAAPGRRRRPRRALRAGRGAARPRASGSHGGRPVSIDDLLDDPATRMIVCCGSGGVGKTTTVGRAGAPGRGARAHGRRAHDRPGAPAGPGARA